MCRRRILVVDDEPDLRSSLALRLRGSGYEVSTATNESDAVSEVLDAPPCVILLDIRLGQEDGHTVMERLRRISGARSIPVIFLTASTHPGDRDRAQRRGAAAYITKPFDPTELLDIIERALAVAT